MESEHCTNFLFYLQPNQSPQGNNIIDISSVSSPLSDVQPLKNLSPYTDLVHNIATQQITIPTTSECVLQAEIDYNIDFEMAYNLDDVLFRRSNQGFTSIPSMQQTTLPFTMDYMTKRFNWNEKQQKYQQKRVEYLLQHMSPSIILSGSGNDIDATTHA